MAWCRILEDLPLAEAAHWNVSVGCTLSCAVKCTGYNTYCGVKCTENCKLYTVECKVKSVECKV